MNHSFARLLLTCFALWWPVRIGLGDGPPRYEAKSADGQRWTGSQLTDWSSTDSRPRLNGRELFSQGAPLRWLRRRGSGVSLRPEACVETVLGDLLPGRVAGFQSGDALPLRAFPDHVLVVPTFEMRPPQDRGNVPLRVASRWIRRIRWQPTSQRYEPGLLVMKDGRKLTYRALRWQADGVLLLLDAERRSVTWEEMADLHLRIPNQWEDYFDELSILGLGSERLMQVETDYGLIATAGWSRQRAYARGDATNPDTWVHGLQPVWSLDVLWLPASRIAWRRFFAADEVLLSRIRPQQVVQESTFAGKGRPWQCNHNVEGGPLVTSAGAAGWGFGVHAENQLHFALPPAARQFRSSLALDRLSRSGGCIQGRVQLRINDAARDLFTSPSIVGSDQVVDTGLISLAADTGPRRLVLQVREHHDDRPTGADPFDIRDSADWIEPILNVVPGDVAPPLADRLPRQLAAWQSWQLVSESGDLAWSTVYDQLSSSLPSYRLAVTGNHKPLVLEREWTWQPDRGWLIVYATSVRRAASPPRIEVFADGRLLAEFDVPLLDRDHPSARPQAISLAELPRDKAVRLRLQQSADAAGTPVLWHSLAVTEQRPDRG